MLRRSLGCRTWNVQQIQTSSSSWAAILGDGSVVTWGREGDSRAVQHVRHIQATDWAFAAILGDGSVVTWGDARRGGNCVQLLDGVTAIARAKSAFAAIKQDRTVVTWGDADCGGDSTAVQDQHLCPHCIQPPRFRCHNGRRQGGDLG